jgi:hypothetical protein
MQDDEFQIELNEWRAMLLNLRASRRRTSTSRPNHLLRILEILETLSPHEDDDICCQAGLSQGRIEESTIRVEFGKECGGSAVFSRRDNTECHVCLEPFQVGETIRKIIRCSHSFHVQCIDTWLKKKLTCPVCRCHVASVERE